MKKIIIVMALMLAFIPVQQVQAFSYDDSFHATDIGFTSTSLRWKKKKATSIKIDYDRSTEQLAEQTYRYHKKIAGSKTSYELTGLKKNTLYTIKIQFYNKKKVNYWAEIEVYTGDRKPSFDEYILSDYKKNTSVISLSMLAGDGIKPSGYEIQRKEIKDKKYKTIKTIKTSKRTLEYADKTVKKGHYYKYRFRTYHKEWFFFKYNSPYSDAVRLDAVNKEGTFKIKKIKENVYRLTSEKYNGEVRIAPSDIWLIDADEAEKKVNAKVGKTLKTMKSGEKKIDIAPKSSFYIQLTDKHIDKKLYRIKVNCVYDHLPCFMEFAFDDISTKAVMNSEAIH